MRVVLVRIGIVVRVVTCAAALVAVVLRGLRSVMVIPEGRMIVEGHHTRNPWSFFVGG